MTSETFDILDYSQSPKTTKRTSFQDELETALSARASKTTSILYSKDLDEDGDDFLDSLLKSRKNRSDAFKASKRSTVYDFDFTEDDEKQGTKERMSFLKSPKRISDQGDRIAPQNTHETTNTCQSSENEVQHKSDETKLTTHWPSKDNASISLSYQSDDAPLDLPLPFYSSISPEPIRLETREDTREDTHGDETVQTLLDADLKCAGTSDIEKETPKPKPRQRRVGLNRHVTENAEASPSAPLATNSCNITDASFPERITAASCSPKLTDGHNAELSASDGRILGDSKEQQRPDSASLEAPNKESGELAVAQVTRVQSNSDIRASSCKSMRPYTLQYKKVESKYLGTLKILDRKISQDCQLQDADSIRATVYQEWLKKKKEKLSESLNKEKSLQEQNKKIKEEEEKKKDAAASYLAWKEKKNELLREKTKEAKYRMQKEQMALEEVEKKRKEAEQTYDQWKSNRDHILREKCRQQRETEKKLALKKQAEAEDRKRDSKSAYSNWCEKKTDAFQKKMWTERQENKNKSEERRYIQEEKDKMALEMYEHWLEKKDLQQKRQREEKRLQVILRKSPPPPWSPPNNTIQFRK
ncbi:microtubule-associated protein 9 [Corythoichthys intestinalis]|uniref:microtubule-associated protein 9 n=1 Tax=Corythoichthys intestinalis TaxID=161448 RepID=UPI0025A645CF|nr:microtubule-associated protein 9 [Corythoichthys intestinalis]